MKKVLDFLERYVEWVVLLAGLAFAGYMTWTYVIDSPVYIEMANEKVGPNEIDQKILDGPGAQLDGLMHSPAPTASVPVPNFVESFRSTMNYSKQTSAAPGNDALVLWPQTPPIKFSDLPSLPTPTGVTPPSTPGETVTGVGGSGNVTRLPQVPTPQLIATRSDMSFVAVPGQQPVVQAQPAVGEDGVTPVAAPPVAMVGMDRTWASVLFTIDAAALGKQWDEIHLPASNTNTVFLQIVLERQELKPDGTWSEPTVLPPLAAGVANMPAVPGNSKPSVAEAQGYISWATPHQKDILQPAFYTILKGRKWAPPGVEVTMTQTDVKFDATKYLDAKNDVLNKLTLEQRALVQKEKTKKAQEAAKGRRSAPRPSTPVGGAPPAEGGGGDQAISDPDRPNFVAADPVAADNAGAPANPATAGARSPARPAAPTQTVAQLVTYPIPSSDFDPSKWADDHAAQPLFVGWAHDESVQAGHTYRYRVSYRLKNPVLFANSAVKDARLAEQFDLRSSPSEWSSNVEVRAAVNFWLVSASDTSGVASVDVFRWQGGDAKSKRFKVSAGDMIGGKEGNIDYATGWAVVDMRIDPRTSKVFVLLMDPSGVVHRRDVEADSTNPQYLELRQQSTSTSAGPVGVPTASR